MKMNLPNKLSVIRFILSIIMIFVMYLCPDKMFLGLNLKTSIIGIIFIIGSLTDYFDGKIARANNLITDFGKFIDPLADKVLVLTAMVLMVEIKKIPAWIPIIVLIREFAVSGFRLVKASKNGEVIAASKWGKIKTTTQMFAIAILLFSNLNFMGFDIKNLFNLQNGINFIGSILLIISVIATIFSGYDYLKHGKDILEDA